MMNQIDPEPPYNHSFRVGAEQWAVNFENYPYQRDLQKLNRPLCMFLAPSRLFDSFILAFRDPPSPSGTHRRSPSEPTWLLCACSDSLVLATILVLDHSKKPYQKFQENVIILPKQIWWADDEDTDLFDLVPFIKCTFLVPSGPRSCSRGCWSFFLRVPGLPEASLCAKLIRFCLDISEQVAKKQDIRDVLPHYESIDPSALVRHVMREQAAAGPRGRVTRVDQQPF